MNLNSDFESSIELSDFLNTINQMGVGLTIVDARIEGFPLVYINQGFTAMTGYQKEEVLWKNCRFLQGLDTDPAQLEKVREAIREVKSESVTLKNYRKDGNYFWNQFIISPIVGEEGEPIYFIGLQFDVTKEVEKEHQSEQEINQLSHFDQLTGLMRLPYFINILQKYLEKDHKNGAILRINLNRFRNINYSYGENLSDQVLIDLANRIKTVFGNAPVTRSFADDFIVFFPYSKRSELETSLIELELALKKGYFLSGDEVTIDYSIGVSFYPEHSERMEQLISYAALAMKESKHNPLSNVAYFNNVLMERLQTRMTIEKKMHKALQLNEYVLEYQPKVDVQSNKVIGMEALLRWRDHERGLISPGEFIPVAEETGFIIELGEWVLLEACKQNKAWQGARLHPVPVSVNVSALQFNHPHFLKTVKQVLEETGLDAQYLELEITETLIVNPENIIRKLTELKQLGVRISIDDFGTGYSSIQYLKDLPVDTLKIDRAFVKDTPDSKRDNALLLSIIQLGKSLGLSVLAEGVETKEQVDFLKENQCDYIQGYYYGKPTDVQTMEAYLNQKS